MRRTHPASVGGMVPNSTQNVANNTSTVSGHIKYQLNLHACVPPPGFGVFMTSGQNWTSYSGQLQMQSHQPIKLVPRGLDLLRMDRVLDQWGDEMEENEETNTVSGLGSPSAITFKD